MIDMINSYLLGVHISERKIKYRSLEKMANTSRRRSSVVRVEVESGLTSRMREHPTRRQSIKDLLASRPLTLYLSTKSVPCRTVHLYLLQYNISHDVVNIDEGGEAVKEALSGISPLGVLPVMKDGDNVVFGFMACIQYLGDEYCHHQGLGGTIKLRAKCDSILNWATNALYRDVVEMLVDEQLAVEENSSQDLNLSMNSVTFARGKVVSHLKTLENVYLSEGQYLLGDEPSFADVHVVMTLDTLDMISYRFSKFPRVEEWRERVREHYGSHWEMVCLCYNIRLMQRGSRRASMVE